MTFLTGAHARRLSVYFVLLVCSLIITNAEQFEKDWQTDSGYDNTDSSDAICFDSPVNPVLREGFLPRPPSGIGDSSDESSAEQDEFDGLMDEFYSGISGPAKLRSQCHQDLTMTVNPVKPVTNGTFASGEIYRLRIQMSLKESSVFFNKTTFPYVLAPPTKVWFRIVCCNILTAVGFCHPFVDPHPPEALPGQSPEGDIQESDDDTPDDGYDEDDQDEDVEESWVPDDGFQVPATRIVRGRHSGRTHIIGDFIQWELAESNDGNGTLAALFDMRFRYPPAARGVYSIVAHAVMFFAPGESPATVEKQVDVASILPSRTYTLQPPPTIQTITDPFKVAIGIILGVVGACQAFLLVYVMRHRKNTILRMTQATWLVILLFFSILATASSAFFMPTKDIYCNISGPLVFTSLSIMASILVGRLWRIYSILSVSMQISAIGVKRRRNREKCFMQALSYLADWEYLCCFFRKCSKTRVSLASESLRKQVTNRHLLQLVVVLSMPQIIWQICTLVFYPKELVVELNEAATVGRIECSSGSQLPDALSLVLVGLTYFLACCMAWVSRELPSFLNETNSIFSASCLSLLVTFIGGLIIWLTNVEPTSPNVKTFVWIVITASIALSASLYTVLPKVRRVWTGEKVVLSQLFSQSEQSHSRSSGSTERTPASTNSRTDRQSEATIESATSPGGGVAIDSERLPFVIKQDSPPPHRVAVQMLTMKELLTKICLSLQNGRVISRRDWEVLQSSAAAMNGQLERLVFEGTEEESAFPCKEEKRVPLPTAFSQDEAQHEQANLPN